MITLGDCKCIKHCHLNEIVIFQGQLVQICLPGEIKTKVKYLTNGVFKNEPSLAECYELEAEIKHAEE